MKPNYIQWGDLEIVPDFGLKRILLIEIEVEAFAYVKFYSKLRN
jgi:hypothetical protein